MKVTIDYEGDNQGALFMQKCMEIGISYLIESYNWEHIGEKSERKWKDCYEICKIVRRY